MIRNFREFSSKMDVTDKCSNQLFQLNDLTTSTLKILSSKNMANFSFSERDVAVFIDAGRYC